MIGDINMGKGKSYYNSSRHLTKNLRQVPPKNPKWTKAPNRNKNQQRKKTGIMLLQIVP